MIGEAATSEAHVHVLLDQFRKMHPDMLIVKDRMARTFPWRRREIVEGISIEELIKKKYPFLTTPEGVRQNWLYRLIGSQVMMESL